MQSLLPTSSQATLLPFTSSSSSSSSVFVALFSLCCTYYYSILCTSTLPRECVIRGGVSGWRGERVTKRGEKLTGQVTAVCCQMDKLTLVLILLGLSFYRRRRRRLDLDVQMTERETIKPSQAMKLLPRWGGEGFENWAVNCCLFPQHSLWSTYYVTRGCLILTDPAPAPCSHPLLLWSAIRSDFVP